MGCSYLYVEELCKGQQTLQLTLAINQIIIIRPTVKHNWLKYFLTLQLTLSINQIIIIKAYCKTQLVEIISDSTVDFSY